MFLFIKGHKQKIDKVSHRVKEEFVMYIVRKGLVFHTSRKTTQWKFKQSTEQELCRRQNYINGP